MSHVIPSAHHASAGWLGRRPAGARTPSASCLAGRTPALPGTARQAAQSWLSQPKMYLPVSGRVAPVGGAALATGSEVGMGLADSVLAAAGPSVHEQPTATATPRATVGFSAMTAPPRGK
eukprot:14314978-Alexandrium_andersonii.AAC.1